MRRVRRRKRGSGRDAIVTAVARRPAVDVVDTTWIAVVPLGLAAELADPAHWRRWWPDLELEVDELRGAKGVRWRARQHARGPLAGSMEVYLQPVILGSSEEAGTLAHYFLRLDPVVPYRLCADSAARLVEQHRRRAKRVFWELSDRCDPGRLARLSAPPPGRAAEPGRGLAP
jgi:hypothetical protein